MFPILAAGGGLCSALYIYGIITPGDSPTLVAGEFVTALQAVLILTIPGGVVFGYLLYVMPMLLVRWVFKGRRGVLVLAAFPLALLYTMLYSFIGAFSWEALIDPSLYFWVTVGGFPFAVALAGYTAVFLWLRWRAALHLFAWILPILSGTLLVISYAVA